MCSPSDFANIYYMLYLFKQEQPPPDKQDQSSPDKQDQPSPDKQDQPSPDKQDKPPPDKQDQPSPDKQDQPPPDTVDRILATIYGQCIGDAIGLLTEFLTKREAKRVRHIYIY